jgi:hypothetical protein
MNTSTGAPLEDGTEAPTIELVSPQKGTDECNPQPCLPSEDDKCKPNW